MKWFETLWVGGQTFNWKTHERWPLFFTKWRKGRRKKKKKAKLVSESHSQLLKSLASEYQLPSSLLSKGWQGKQVCTSALWGKTTLSCGSCQNHVSPGRCHLIPRAASATFCCTIFFSCLIPSCGKRTSSGEQHSQLCCGFGFLFPSGETGL